MYLRICSIVFAFTVIIGCLDNNLQQPAQIPGPPHELRAVALDSSTIHITWVDDAYMEDGFHLFESRGLGYTFELVDTLLPNTTTAILNDRDPDTPYLYKIRSFNINGHSHYANTAAVVDPQLQHELYSNLLQSGGFVYDMDVNSSGNLLAIGGHIYENDSLSGLVECWDIDLAIKQYEIAAANPVGAVAFNPDGDEFAAGELAPGGIKVYNAISGEHLRTYAIADTEYVYGLLYHTGDDYLLSYLFYSYPRGVLPRNEYYRVRIWDTRDDVLVRIFEANKRLHPVWESLTLHLNDVEISPDGRWLAAAFNTDSILVWDARDYHLDRIHINPGTRDITFSSDSKHYAAVSSEGVVRMWSSEDGELISELYDESPVLCALDYTSDDLYLATASIRQANEDGYRPNIWDPYLKIPVKALPDAEGWSGAFTYLRFTSDDDRLVELNLYPSRIKIWKLYR